MPDAVCCLAVQVTLTRLPNSSGGAGFLEAIPNAPAKRGVVGITEVMLVLIVLPDRHKNRNTAPSIGLHINEVFQPPAGPPYYRVRSTFFKREE